MIGLDTNVLVRYVTQDDLAQAEQVEKLVDSLSPANPGFISAVALTEAVWVLRRVFSIEADGISRFITHLLASADLVVEHGDAVRVALLQTQGGLEFTDAVIAEIGRAQGCDHTVTFDRKASVLPGMVRLI
jgi:predicted nucleic-acid-binding protein